MKVPRWLWGTWAAFSVGAFALLETLAATNHTPNDTLTWTTIALVPAAVFFAGFGTFVVWVSLHMAKRYRDRKGGL